MYQFKLQRVIFRLSSKTTFNPYLCYMFIVLTPHKIFFSILIQLDTKRDILPANKR